LRFRRTPLVLISSFFFLTARRTLWRWQIDPFGHSSTQASLLSWASGFDALFFGRIDYQVSTRYQNTSKKMQTTFNFSSLLFPFLSFALMLSLSLFHKHFLLLSFPLQARPVVSRILRINSHLPVMHAHVNLLPTHPTTLGPRRPPVDLGVRRGVAGFPFSGGRRAGVLGPHRPVRRQLLRPAG